MNEGPLAGFATFSIIFQSATVPRRVLIEAVYLSL